MLVYLARCEPEIAMVGHEALEEGTGGGEAYRPLKILMRAPEAGKMAAVGWQLGKRSGPRGASEEPLKQEEEGVKRAGEQHTMLAHWQGWGSLYGPCGHQLP
ncbi:hypothetical protein NDU88_007778 [Pleurodeles waltl]|uniref:Uncharacterized protein n=1 Tax=Pleurodeles waltl TaxID=8319 RepID=A0AAV7RTZ7_PLEWA|nr:hypothetical protein NDU88_007778 [Pleurodeles waltl]